MFASVSIWLTSYTSCIIIFVQVHEWISIGTKNAKKARNNIPLFKKYIKYSTVLIINTVYVTTDTESRNNLN